MVSNPRFPHHCRIYRRVDDPFHGTTFETDLYEGECRKSPNRTGGYAETPVKGDFRLGVPDTDIDVKSGDLMDITDKSDTYTAVTVTDAYVGNLGTTIYFNLTKN